MLFKEILNSDFKNYFKFIVFAILDKMKPQDHNPDGNLKPFAKVFNKINEVIEIDKILYEREDNNKKDKIIDQNNNNNNNKS